MHPVQLYEYYPLAPRSTVKTNTQVNDDERIHLMQTKQHILPTELKWKLKSGYMQSNRLGIQEKRGQWTE